VIRGPRDKTEFRDHPTDWKGYIDPLPACDIATPTDTKHPSVSTYKKAWPKYLTDWASLEAAKSAWKYRTALVDMTEAEAVDLIAPASNRVRDAAAGRGHSIHDLLEHHLNGDLADGILLLDVDDPAHEYIAAVESIIATFNPVVLASEVVVFGEWTDPDGVTHRWAGTFDAVWDIDGENVLVDYKSRKLGKAATRYPEDGAQLGGYGSATYWVVEGADGLCRMAPLQIDRMMLLSIAPDAVGQYMVDPQQAIAAWRHTLMFSHAQSAAPGMFARVKKHGVEIAGGGSTSPTQGTVVEREVGSVEDTHQPASPPDTPVEPTPGAPGQAGGGEPSSHPPSADLHAARTGWVIAKATELSITLGKQAVAAVWPQGVAPPGHVASGAATWTDGDIDLIALALRTLEAKHEHPFGMEDPKVTAERRTALQTALAADHEAIQKPPAPEPATEPAGEYADPDDVQILDGIVRGMARSSDPLERDRIARAQMWQQQATKANVPWKIGAYPRDEVPERLYCIAAAAVASLDLVDLDAKDPDRRVRDLLAQVLDDWLALHPTSAIGALFGLLTIDQALQLAALTDTNPTQETPGDTT